MEYLLSVVGGNIDRTPPNIDYLIDVSPDYILRYHLCQDGCPLERHLEDFIDLSQVTWDNRLRMLSVGAG